MAALEQTAAAPGTASPAAPQPSRDGVFLAETTSDLREQRESLKRDLQQQGYTVLPDRPIPHVAEEACAAPTNRRVLTLAIHHQPLA